MTEILKIKQEEIPRLSVIASKVVKEHFDKLIGEKQNDYMIEKFQSENAIRKQFEEGYRYYWVTEEGNTAGFLAMYPRDGKMYLSKFYVLSEFRGHHLAKVMLDFVKDIAKKERLPHIFLNVNRGNSDVISIYEHLGFIKVREEKNDIGHGFYMDDYVMQCEV